LQFVFSLHITNEFHHRFFLPIDRVLIIAYKAIHYCLLIDFHQWVDSGANHGKRTSNEASGKKRSTRTRHLSDSASKAKRRTIPMFLQRSALSETAPSIRRSKLNPIKAPVTAAVQSNSASAIPALIQRDCTECDADETKPNNIQTELTVGAEDDFYEREADAVADTVMGAPVSETTSNQVASSSGKSTPLLLQRYCTACDQSDSLLNTDQVQRKSERKSGSGPQERSSGGQVHALITSPGAGVPLPASIRNRIEPVLGSDLSAVRVHSDQRAQNAAGAIQAKAFTNQNNIYLGKGQRSDDVRLMAHEATHTAQQGASNSVSRLLQRDATNQSITPDYASSLRNSEISSEILAVEEILISRIESNEVEESLQKNLSILRQEFFKRRMSGESRTIDQFQRGNPGCYDRKSQPYTMVVDAYVHYEPFGGGSVPTSVLYDFFRDAGVLFTSAYGIGQTLPWWSSCTYYKDCPWVPVTPSMQNDLLNAYNLTGFDPQGVHTIVSRSFADPAEPQDILWKTYLLDYVFPGTFKGMGELNLVKQALFQNWHRATPKEVIAEWAGFMAFLRERDMPIAIHSDLASDPSQPQLLPDFPDFIFANRLQNDPSSTTDLWHGSSLNSRAVNQCPGHSCHESYSPQFNKKWHQSSLFPDPTNGLFAGSNAVKNDAVKKEQTKYLFLMEEVLRQYPHNKIVWMHLGLSEELVSIDPRFHIAVLTKLLDAYPKLMLDISWKVLYEHYFQYPEKRKHYVEFFNAYSDRNIAGTDFIADEKKSYEDYKEVVELNSFILKFLDDKAFKKITLEGG